MRLFRFIYIKKAAFYEIKAAYNPTVLADDLILDDSDEDPVEKNSDEILPIKIHAASFTNYMPNQGGSEEWFSIDLNKLSQHTFSLIMRAVDASNNAGEWSQILTVKTDKNFMLAPQLRHYYHVEENAEFLVNKPEINETKENFYWNIIVFIIGMKIKIFSQKNKNYFLIYFILVSFSLVGLIQVGFLVALIVLEVMDKKRKKIKRGVRV